MFLMLWRKNCESVFFRIPKIYWIYAFKIPLNPRRVKILIFTFKRGFLMYWLAIISSRVSPPLFCHCCSIGVLQLTFPPSPGHCPYNFLATFPDSMFWNLFISFLPPPSCFHCLVCKGAEPRPQEDNMVEQQFLLFTQNFLHLTLSPE